MQIKVGIRDQVCHFRREIEPKGAAQFFLEHLGDLRSLLVTGVSVFLGCSIVYWFFSGRILEWIVAGVPVDHLVFYAPSEAFMVRTKLAFVCGGITAFPYLAYRVWRFVTPGLFKREKSKVGPVVFVLQVDGEPEDDELSPVSVPVAAAGAAAVSDDSGMLEALEGGTSEETIDALEEIGDEQPAASAEEPLEELDPLEPDLTDESADANKR